MARVSIQNEITAWRDGLSDALEYRRKYGLEDQWAGLEGLFYNTTDSRIGQGPNLIASNGDAMLSELTVPEPYVRVIARRQDALTNAPVVEAIDNWLLEEIRLSEQVEYALLHAFLWGKGIIKLGYDSEFGFDPSNDVGMNGMTGITLSQFNDKGKMIESGIAKPGMPWGMAVLPHDIAVPWGTTDIETAPWVAHRIVRHIDEVRADPKYSNTKGLEPNVSMEDFVNSYSTVMKPYRAGSTTSRRGMTSKAEFVELWEFHCARTRRVIVLATGYDKMLRSETDLLQLEGLPFVTIDLVPKARSFWVTPDASFLKQPQDEIDDITLQTSKQRRLGILKFLASEDAFDENELNKLTSAEIGAVAKVRSGVAMTEAIMKLENSNNNMAVYQDAEYIRRGAREVIGLSRNQMGEYESAGRRTAREVMAVKEASQTRMGRRAAKVKGLYEKTIRKVNQIVFAFWNTQRVIEVVGPEGESTWVQYTGDQIKGEYSYKIKLVETQTPGPAQAELGALELYGQLSQDPNIDPLALREYVVNASSNPAMKRIFKTGANPSANLRDGMSKGTSSGGVQSGNAGNGLDGAV